MDDIHRAGNDQLDHLSDGLGEFMAGIQQKVNKERKRVILFLVGSAIGILTIGILIGKFLL